MPTEMELNTRINQQSIRLDTSAGNPVKEILLKLNLPDHRSILTDSKMEVKITFSLTSEDKGTSSFLQSKDTKTYSQDKVNERHEVYELKTKDKA
ncbi:hypothetical protein Tco_1438097 [Tanacetum coccineum]